MGRVRPNLIKSLGKQLVDKHPEAFGDDFEENKDKVGEYAAIDSKHVRNRVAGYVTHLKGLDAK